LFALESNVFLFIGLVPVILGIVILIGFIWGFIAAGTGTPVLYDMPEKMIVRGSYRFVRNPMYVGGCLLLLGQAIAFKSFGFLLYLAVLFSYSTYLSSSLKSECSRRNMGNYTSSIASRCLAGFHV
jgi:protein-S-isoprenylcysteine O-methyltransferase Ste14